MFQALAHFMGVPLMQINVISAEILALVFAFAYRHYLCPTKVSVLTRQVSAASLGMCLLYFVYGSQSIHVFIHSAICYTTLLLLPTSIIHIATFILSMSYLMCIHLWRVLAVDIQKYPLDVSGPLMLSTLKVTIVAFGLHDGLHRKPETLIDNHKRHSLRQKPSFLEYLSYIFYFQSVVAGPPAFYCDYQDFVRGENIHLPVNSQSDMEINSNDRKDGDINVELVKNSKKVYRLPPSPLKPVCLKLCETLFWVIIHVRVAPSFPALLNSDPAFIASHGFLYRTGYMLISMTCCKVKYYLIWILGDAINNASGLGFNGFTSSGQAKWDLITNIKPFSLELSTSAKMFLDNWNIQTVSWFRYICYTRIPFQRTLFTFILSALWHGCFPGYYFTFISGAFMIQASRMVRRKVRPFFLRSTSLKMFYDFITFLMTHIAITYTGVAFNLLYFKPSMMFYNHMNWWLHIVCVIAMLVCLVLPNQPRQQEGKVTMKNGHTSETIKSS
ncbi:lysophospholipid acyltransferase 1-like [Ylistrum balloti]|uniref:lysophospholipid acyltransferase 1-like n=1 Tax=Ylistrum balloti TaxID=509963 RepID=UPI002905D32C|nr:lysophospholipid acyltransferase 1-like [Ylistrum balloti]